MSEEKTEEVINLLKMIVEQNKQKSQESGSSEVHHIFDPNCPTCKPKIDAYVKPLVDKSREEGKEEVLKIFKERSDREKYPYQCIGDGCGVSKEEEKDQNFKCPTCGENRQRKR